MGGLQQLSKLFFTYVLNLLLVELDGNLPVNVVVGLLLLDLAHLLVGLSLVVLVGQDKFNEGLVVRVVGQLLD